MATKTSDIDYEAKYKTLKAKYKALKLQYKALETENIQLKTERDGVPDRPNRLQNLGEKPATKSEKKEAQTFQLEDSYYHTEQASLYTKIKALRLIKVCKSFSKNTATFTAIKYSNYADEAKRLSNVPEEIQVKWDELKRCFLVLADDMDKPEEFLLSSTLERACSPEIFEKLDFEGDCYQLEMYSRGYELISYGER